MSVVLSRRLFLQGVLSVVAAKVVSIVPAMPAIPILYGDGVNDDAAGLQAVFDGLPVDIRSDVVRLLSGDYPIISGGVFRITRGLVARYGRTIQIEHARIVTAHPLNEPILHATLGAVVGLDDSTIHLAEGTWQHPLLSSDSELMASAGGTIIKV